jgi:hypothetical protein
MSVWNKIGTSTWTKINSIFTKTSGSWTEIIGVWVKTSSNVWTRVFTRLLLPANTVPPAITGSTKLYGTLTGSIGTWTAPNGSNSYARQWQSAANVNDAPGSFGTTQTSGETSSTYTTTDAVDGRWVRVRVVATNLSGNSTAFSDSVLITRFKPVALIIPEISGTPAVNITLTALTTVGTYWKNTTTNNGDTAPDSFTYRWYWGDTGDNIGTNSSTYTVVEADLGHTIRVDVTAKNTGGETTSTSNQTATVGQSIGISNVTFTDSNGNNGFNNRGNLVTATSTRLSWRVSGVNSSTTFRVRYRVLNNQTGAYWSPDSESATTASAAWLVYESNYNNVGNISNVTISGGDAFIYDIFSIPEIFNGSTYSGGLSRWTWEYEISAVIGGTRYYWVPGDTVSTSFTFDYWDIDPTSLGTITATPTSGGPGTSVTFSGIIQSYPSGLNTYPYAYRVVYGDGNNSGWIYPSYGTNKPTYSLSNTYNSTGNYTAYVETIPDYSISTASVSISNVLTAPTITNVVAGNSSGQPVTVYFTGGSGPFYQIWWTTGVAGTSYDEYGSSSPITDNTGPTSASTAWFAYVRSVSSPTNTGTGPSSTISAWSAGYQFTVTQAPIIPTISMSANSNITQTSGTINWTSTNQSSFSSNGTFSGTGTTGTSISKSGLAAGTTYTGTVTVTSSTGNTASANYSLTTSSAPVASVTSMRGSTGGRTSNVWNNPKATITYNFANTTSSTTRIQRSIDNVNWDSGIIESYSGNSATQSTNQPTGTTATSGNYYYRGQVMSLNGVTLPSPITSASFRNTVTPINNRAIYP